MLINQVTAVAFDKTGTLTKGNTVLTDFVSVVTKKKSSSSASANVDMTSCGISRVLLQLLYAAEARSSHPLSRGIATFCAAAATSFPSLPEPEANSGVSVVIDSMEDEVSALSDNGGDYADSDFVTDGEHLIALVPGMGIKMLAMTTSIDSVESLLWPEESAVDKAPPSNMLLVGNAKLLKQHNVQISETMQARAKQMRSSGKVVVFASLGANVRAIIGLSDTVRPETASVLATLSKHGIQCFMVTGDEEVTAHAVAAQIGISPDHVLASAKPDDKKSFIEMLQNQRNLKVAFVGDGTNDSPALAQAEVGIAMAGGTDLAVESGDMVLCKSSLDAVVVALDISKSTMNRIMLNYGWALIYNVFLIPLAAGVFYPSFRVLLAPMYAGAAMALSSVSIVLSSLSLQLYRAPRLVSSPASTAAAAHAQAVDTAVTQSQPRLTAQLPSTTLERLCTCSPPAAAFVVAMEKLAEQQSQLMQVLGYLTSSSSGVASAGASTPGLANLRIPVELAKELRAEDGGDGIVSVSLPAHSACGCGASNCQCGSSCRCGTTSSQTQSA